MKAKFRQGIIKYQRTPSFLQLSEEKNITLDCSRTDVLLNFCYGKSNYLFYEKNTISNAWELPKKFTGGWLYWDIDINSGERTFGVTFFDPFITSKPTTPEYNQMFFDRKNTTYYYWNNSSWVECIRIIAGYVESTLKIIPIHKGSQVNIFETCILSELIFDNQKQPVKKVNKTNVDIENTSINEVNQIDNLSYDQLMLNAGIANSNLQKGKCVYWTNYNILDYADSSLNNMAVGILENDISKGKFCPITSKGFVKNNNWVWDLPPNTPLFLGKSGEITENPDSAYSIQKIGYIVSNNTIYVDFGNILFKQ